MNPSLDSILVKIKLTYPVKYFGPKQHDCKAHWGGSHVGDRFLLMIKDTDSSQLIGEWSAKNEAVLIDMLAQAEEMLDERRSRDPDHGCYLVLFEYEHD